eukprot:974550-Pyramimonas_sp.AAC.1
MRSPSPRGPAPTFHTSGEESHAHAPILAMPVLDPGSVHMPSWPWWGGVWMGLARIGVRA